MIPLLKEKAEAVQTVVRELPTLEDAFRYTVVLTCQQHGQTIAAPGLAPQLAERFAALCREHGLTLLTADLRNHAEAIHTGFTVADWAIAETATVVMDSSPEDVRIATMLSETHVAAVPRSIIRTEAVELAVAMRSTLSAPPSYLSFISGASRTADIERVLTIGVHGPKEFHLVILEEDPT